MNGGGHLESLEQDGFLSLQANVSRPFDESSQVTFRLDILT